MTVSIYPVVRCFFKLVISSTNAIDEKSLSQLCFLLFWKSLYLKFFVFWKFLCEKEKILKFNLLLSSPLIFLWVYILVVPKKSNHYANWWRNNNFFCRRAVPSKMDLVRRLLLQKSKFFYVDPSWTCRVVNSSC